jgi:hypothetical protein
VLTDDPNTAVAMRTAEPADVAAEILAQERRPWTTSLNDHRWQATTPLSARAREEAVLGLLLLGPRTVDDAIDVLQLLPRFRARSRDSDLLDNVAEWTHHLYPDPSEWLQPGPACSTAPCPRPASRASSAIPPRQFTSGQFPQQRGPSK